MRKSLIASIGSGVPLVPTALGFDCLAMLAIGASTIYEVTTIFPGPGSDR